MPGLAGSTTGLSFGIGLILSTAAAAGEGNITFAGTGGLSVGTIQTTTDKVTLAGAGNLSATHSGPYLTNPVTFAGAGSLSALGTWNISTNPATFAGTGTLTGNTSVPLQQDNATFAGSGSLSATVSLALSASVGFAGAGGKGGL